tara:strand:+ start:291 stop:482 length:192 start_codon:yes stop_codon:yes gene_type:complete
MKHFEAIKLIGYRIEELRKEVDNLKVLTKEEKNYSGYVFAKEDILNMTKQVESLSESMKKLLN